MRKKWRFPRSPLWQGVAPSLLCVALLARLAGAADYPEPVEGDYRLDDFEFHTGEVLPELNLHYRTLGERRVDDSGRTTNAAP